MKKKILPRLFKWIGLLILVFVVVQVANLYAVLHPEYFFDYSREYGSFRVYSSEPIDPEIDEILKEVKKRVKESEVYSTDAFIKIIFTCEGLYFSLCGSSIIPRTIGNCVILGGEVDIAQNRLVLPAVKMNLIYILSHEAVHVGQHEEHGLLMSTVFDFGRHESWKIEGYAEWIAHEDQIFRDAESVSKTLTIFGRHRSDQWVNLGDGYTMPKGYLRNRMMIEYLISRKGMKYSEIIENSISEIELWDTIQKAEPVAGGDRPR